LQTSISKANAAASKYESELQQAQMKLRLAETQTGTAKAAEQRITAESNQLRNEISRQGALIESIQRIEASLSAKATAEEESFEGQIISLTQKLSFKESKHAAELESLNGKVSDQDIRMRDLEQRREQAANDALAAKEESLTATAESQKLTTKCSLLEAQLRAAKKKLGETSDDVDVEAELRNKITSLTEELEASRIEVATLKERAATYQKTAKDNEDALVEATEATNAAKKSQGEELETLKSQLETAHTEKAKRKEIITELTNDLAAQRGERAKELEEVNKSFSELQSQAEEYQKDAEASQSRYAELEAEVVVLRADVSSAQSNYERELALHSTARTDLRAAREEV
jgi:nucleoprotein TPR